MLYPQIPRNRRHSLPCRATRGSTRVDQEAEKEGKTWAKAFIVVFMGMIRHGRVRLLRIG